MMEMISGRIPVSYTHLDVYKRQVETWLPGIVRFRPYQVNRELLERTENPDCIVIHMLPSTHNMDHASGQKLLSVIEDPDPVSYTHLEESATATSAFCSICNILFDFPYVTI